MKVKAKVIAVLVGLLACVGGVAATESPAFAASGDPGTVLAGSCVYSGPSTFYGILYCTSYNANIPLGCWTDDGQGHRWFSFYRSPGNWVLANDVINQPVLPHC